MKRLIIAAAIAVSLVSATVAPAHDDKNHVKKEERQANGHAATLGKPGDPGKVTRSIAVDYAPTVRCVAVCPGSVDTPMWREGVQLSPDPAVVIAECEAMHLTGRVAQPAEIADFIVFLCSGRAQFVTGQAYRIDGGLGVMIPGSKRG